MKDFVGLQKVEEGSKYFLIEKIIHGVEFQNPYNTPVEKKPEIIETVESNYRVIRRVYQHLWVNTAELSDITITNFILYYPQLCQGF